MITDIIIICITSLFLSTGIALQGICVIKTHVTKTHLSMGHLAIAFQNWKPSGAVVSAQLPIRAQACFLSCLLVVIAQPGSYFRPLVDW